MTRSICDWDRGPGAGIGAGIGMGAGVMEGLADQQGGKKLPDIEPLAREQCLQQQGPQRVGNIRGLLLGRLERDAFSLGRAAGCSTPYWLPALTKSAHLPFLPSAPQTTFV